MKKQIEELRDSGFLKLARITYVLQSCKTIKQATDTLKWGRVVLEQHFSPSWKYNYGIMISFEISYLNKQFQKMLDAIADNKDLLMKFK